VSVRGSYKNLSSALLVLIVGCAGAPPADLITTPGTSVGTTVLTRTSCDSLSEPLKTRARSLLSKIHAHSCCDETLLKCLEEEKRCLSVVRSAQSICRRLEDGQDDERITRALALRARMLMSEHFHERSDEGANFDLTGAQAAGAADAPVEVVQFSGPRGVHCARITPHLYNAVSSGPLAGKVRLFLKPFPLRSNQNSKEAGIAFLAARELGAFWEFVIHAYENFGDFTPAVQSDWAEAVGLDRGAFEKLLEDPRLVERLIDSKKEGLTHGVESTPTFFINGHLYTGELEIEELRDTLEEIFDMVHGVTHEE
jgi:hypothetical protein